MFCGTPVEEYWFNCMIKAYLIKLVTVVQNVDGSVKVLM